MGADGGIVWMMVKDPSKYKRVKELLYPFSFTEWCCADWQEDANSNFLDKNADISEPEYLVGTYGTNQDTDLNDLKNILTYEPEELCSDPSLTFSELLEDLESRPVSFKNNSGPWQYLHMCKQDVVYLRHYCYDVNGNHLSPLEIILWDCMRYHSVVDRMINLNVIAHMTVLNWYEELQTLLNPNKTYMEETWT